MTQYLGFPFSFAQLLLIIVILLLGFVMKRYFYAKNAFVAYTKINSNKTLITKCKCVYSWII